MEAFALKHPFLTLFGVLILVNGVVAVVNGPRLLRAIEESNAKKKTAASPAQAISPSS